MVVTGVTVSFSKHSAKIVILRVVTVLEKEDLDEVISELNQRCKKQSKWFGKVEDCFIYQSNLYIVEEYFENGSLMDLVVSQADGGGQEEEARRI